MIQLLIFILTLWGGYCFLVGCIAHLTPCTFLEAHKKIVAFLFDREPYHIHSDPTVCNTLWDRIHAVIGDTRFSDLLQMAQTTQVFGFGMGGGMRFLWFTVIFDTETEKIRLQKTLTAELSKWLRIHNFPCNVLVDWEENPTLALPTVILRYAETSDESRVLSAYLQEQTRHTLQRYQAITDDQEDF